VDAKAVTDGDTITVYVNIANHPESGNVPQEVHKAVIERTKARVTKNYQRADALQKIILDAGYRSFLKNHNYHVGNPFMMRVLTPLSSGCRQVPNMRGEHVLAKKYRIRLRFAPTSCSRINAQGLVSNLDGSYNTTNCNAEGSMHQRA
jgi:hypothetical protein